MKKTLTINLNNLVFNIEEDAYDKLNKYLESVKAYFAAYDESREILNDIEARLAEQFSAKINDAKEVITSDDVEEMIKTMGTVEAIAGEQNDFKPEATGRKKFFRDPDNAIIFGVASGIAAYFNIDPIFIRLAFAVSVLFGGTGIIVYVILCFVMPPAKTTSSKMEMRGQTPNLSSFKEAAKEKVQQAKEEIKASRWPRQAAVALGQGTKYFSLAILIIIGVSIIISAVAALVALFFAFGTMAFNANSPYLDFPLGEVLPGATLYLAVLAVSLVCIIPIIFLLMLGLALVRRKSPLNLASVLVLLMVWVISLTASGIFAIKYAPRFEEKMQAFEQTEKSSRTFDLKDFFKIDADNTQEIFISRGQEFKIEAQGLKKDIEQISLALESKTLRIRKKSPWQICLFCFTRRNPLTFKITMPELDEVKARGFYKADISGFDQKEFKLDVDGIGETFFSGHADSFFLAADGTTKTKLVGSSTLTQINIDGVAWLDAFEFPSQEVSILADGASRANVWATQKLDAKTDGVARVFYKGTPIITQETKGASHLKTAE